MCCLLGLGVPQDAVQAVKWLRLAEAMKWFRKAAEQSEINAPKILATTYAQGQRVPQDLAEAQMKLAGAYIIGTGVERNVAEAACWFRKAAEQNFAPAQVGLGSCYLSGEGTPQDVAEAVKLFRTAADHGDASGQFALSLQYERDEGVEKNWSKP
jgi:TPR repeat protein